MTDGTTSTDITAEDFAALVMKASEKCSPEDGNDRLLQELKKLTGTDLPESFSGIRLYWSRHFLTKALRIEVD